MVLWKFRRGSIGLVAGEQRLGEEVAERFQVLLDHFIHSFVLLTVQLGHVLRKVIQFLLEVLPVFLLIVAILFSVEQLLHVDSKREILAELRQPLIQIVELLLAELIVDDCLVPLTGRLEFSMN